MTTAEILKKVRKIEIKTKGLSSHIFSGEYHSAFKGRGMSFSEVREYSPGDDVRTIDWNVTARFSTPFVKVFEEERELTVMLLVDVSGSSLFGTAQLNKREMITEICAVLAFSATTNNDKVGVIFFSDKVEQYIPPKKGKSHILRIIRELITMQPVQNRGTDIRCCLEFLNNVMRKRAIIFLISDFISEEYEYPLKMAARRHDLVGMQVYDRMDMELPDAGLLQVQDSETGASRWIDSSHPATRVSYASGFKKQQQYNTETFLRAGAQLLSVRTDQDYIKTLQGFFRARI